MNLHRAASRNQIPTITTINHLAVFLLSTLAAIASAQAEGKPLNVFILAGQSNMEGHARIETFALMGKAFAEANLEILKSQKR